MSSALLKAGYAAVLVATLWYCVQAHDYGSAFGAALTLVLVRL